MAALANSMSLHALLFIFPTFREAIGVKVAVRTNAQELPSGLDEYVRGDGILLPRSEHRDAR